MPERLSWQRHELGFIAYPMGEDQQRFFAMVRFNGSLPKDVGQWQWSVTARPEPPYVPGDVLARTGHAQSKQAAADAATEAWPIVLEEAKAKGLIHD